MIKSITELVQHSAKKLDLTIAVAVAEDYHVLEAVHAACKQQNTKFLLVGNQEKICTIARELSVDLTDIEIVHEPDVTKAAYKAVELVSGGRANVLMKGLVDTSILMKAVFDREIGLRSGKKLSHLAVFEVPTYHKLLFITDAAINIAPDLDTKRQMIENAVTAVQKLGTQQPKVALLAAKEKVDEKMPVTLEYAELVRLNRADELTGGYVDGPFSVDIAVSKEAGLTKGIDSPVSGEADILVGPDIEASNILYKSLAFLAKSKHGGVVLGVKAPIIMTSRADSSESKLIAIALSKLCC